MPRRNKRIQPTSKPPLRAPHKKRDEKVEVQLQIRHHVNGKSYGPGMVRVPESLANQFLNTEARAADKELSLVQQRAYIITAGRYGPRKKEVPWARFDDILNRSEIPINQLGG